MIKKLFLILVGMSLTLAFSTSVVLAEDFDVSASVPASSSATYTVSRVTNGGTTFTPWTNNLDLGTLKLVDVATPPAPPQFVFLTNDVFYVIDVGINGVGQPDIDLSYTDIANPNGSPGDGTGLEIHGTVAWAHVTTGTPDVVVGIDGLSLGETNGITQEIQEEDLSTGDFFRLIVGTATGDPALNEGAATPFTQADAIGPYSGTLTVTATFD